MFSQQISSAYPQYKSKILLIDKRIEKQLRQKFSKQYKSTTKLVLKKKSYLQKIQMSNQDYVQTVSSFNNMKSPNNRIYKTSSFVTEFYPQESYQTKQEILELKLNESRKFYLNQMQKDVEDAKKKKRQEVIDRRARESQGFVKHSQGFSSAMTSSDFFTPTLYVQPENDNKDIYKIPFVPLKQRIQNSLEAKKNQPLPWFSQSVNPMGTFDMDKTLKPTPKQEQELQQIFDYKNFKAYMKTKLKSTQLASQTPTNQEENTQNRFSQKVIDLEAKNLDQYQLPRSKTFSRGRTVSNQKASERNISIEKIQINQEEQRNKPIIKERQPIINRGKTQSSFNFKPVQSPLSLSITNNSFTPKLDPLKLDSPVANSSRRIISINSPMNKLQSPMNKLQSPMGRNSPMNKTAGQFYRNTQSQERNQNNEKQSQFFSTFNQNDNSGSNWKYSYNTKINAFQPVSIDTYDVKVSNQSKQHNLVFKTNGNLGNLFSEYNNKNGQDQISRDRGLSTPLSSRSQVIQN